MGVIASPGRTRLRARVSHAVRSQGRYGLDAIRTNMRLDSRKGNTRLA